MVTQITTGKIPYRSYIQSSLVKVLKKILIFLNKLDSILLLLFPTLTKNAI